PNYFGSQRFGRDNLRQARDWLVAGGRAPRDRFVRRLIVSAFQSGAFNDSLARRVDATREGADLAALRPGELCRVEASGGLFVVAPGTEDAEAARVAAWETSPTGPLFGPKMPWPEADAAAEERALAASWGFSDAVLGRLGKLGAGTRRPIRVRPGELGRRTLDDGSWELRFTLPPGSYATVLLRELHGDGEEGVPGTERDPRSLRP
ncbi:MAG: tRNA pseudouridine(13) synthase TruD, partial [Myxococcota bacterium]